MNFFDKLKNNNKINLNEQQKQAVMHVDGPALVLAGPGSGKTTVITARTAYLILEAGIKPQNILTLTFNKYAQIEMERRFQRLYSNEIDAKVHFATLHSFCNSVVRSYENMRGQRLKRIEGNDEDINKKHLLKDIYYNINNSKINDDELESLINDIGFVKNKMIKNLDEISLSTKNFSQVFKAYEDYKKSNLLIDFDDMLTYAYSILIKCPNILNYYRNRYKYIQVDEGQDLSKIQFEVLNLLINGNNNFFIVADDDQSIYGFRAAEPQYILDIKKQFENCNIFHLETNYRSSKNIVDLSSKFIKLNDNRFDKDHKTPNKDNSDPIIVASEDEYDQIDFLLKEIKKMQNNKQEIAILYRNNLSSILIADALDRNNIPYKVKQNKLFFFNHWLVKDVTAFLLFALDQSDVEAFSKIYFRMNRYISKSMLESVLKSNEIGKSVIDCIMQNTELKPFKINNLQELKKEFVLLSKKRPWAALEYIKNSFRYLESVKGYCEIVGLSYEYLKRLFEILQGLSTGCETIASFLVRLQELEQLFDGKTPTMQSAQSIPTAQLTQATQIIQPTQPAQQAEAQLNQSTQSAQQAQVQLNQSMQPAQQAQAQLNQSMQPAQQAQAQLNQLTQPNKLDQLKKQDYITLSTLHSSKGLEYDCVFMIDLNNSEIPGSKAIEQAYEDKNMSMLEEERRLFYVGMTRARSTLYLIYPKQINNEDAPRSVFINEVSYLMKKDIINSIGEGSIVTHAKFGRGVVAELIDNPNENQTIKIKFFNGELKTFNLQMCLDKKLLSFE